MTRLLNIYGTNHVLFIMSEIINKNTIEQKGAFSSEYRD